LLADSTNDKEISNLFEDAKDKIDKVEGQATEKKKQVITNLAKELEGKIPQTDTICIEIVNQLRGKISERFIRECLDEKYKQKIRAENAKKQKQQEKEYKISDKLAAVTPLNQAEKEQEVKEEGQENKEVIIVDTDGKTFAEKKEIESFIDKDNLNTKDENFDKLHYGLQQLDQQKLQHHHQQQGKEKSPMQELKKEITNNNELECPSCQQLYIEKLELNEALQKATVFNTAEKITPSLSALNDNYIDKTNDIIPFEFRRPFRELRISLAEIFKKTGDCGKVWINGKINIKTREIISFNFGLFSQRQQQ
jgi:hypothetical protein